MALDYFEFAHDDASLAEVADGVLAEYNFWRTARSTGTGLSRYGMHDNWEGQERFSQLECIQFFKPSSYVGKKQDRRFGANLLVEVESTNGFIPRFHNRCLDFVATVLNALLFEYEETFAVFPSVLNWNYGIDFNQDRGYDPAAYPEIDVGRRKWLFL